MIILGDNAQRKFRSLFASWRNPSDRIREPYDLWGVMIHPETNVDSIHGIAKYMGIKQEVDIVSLTITKKGEKPD